jgi:hypothetical protein
MGLSNQNQSPVSRIAELALDQRQGASHSGAPCGVSLGLSVAALSVLAPCGLDTEGGVLALLVLTTLGRGFRQRPCEDMAPPPHRLAAQGARGSTRCARPWRSSILLGVSGADAQKAPSPRHPQPKNLALAAEG